VHADRACPGQPLPPAAPTTGSAPTDTVVPAQGTHPGVEPRSTSLTSKPVSALLVDLGVTRSHSRPRVSNDNPFSEAQFKTM
jgi:putative transposase